MLSVIQSLQHRVNKTNVVRMVGLAKVNKKVVLVILTIYKMLSIVVVR